MLLKVSSIDGNTNWTRWISTPTRGLSTPAARRTIRQLAGGYHPQQHTERGAVKGEKVKLKVGGALREQLEIGLTFLVRWIWIYAPRRDWRKRIAAQRGSEQQTALLAIHWRKQYQADDLKLKLTGKMTDYTSLCVRQ